MSSAPVGCEPAAPAESAWRRSCSRIVNLVRRLVLCVSLLGVRSARGTEVEQTLEAWLAANNQRVVAFLRTLSEKAVGSKIEGATLTDGTRVAAGYKYQGQVRDAGPGAHVYLFSDGDAPVAYIWIDPSGAPLALPKCEDGPGDDEPQKVLSGDVYTFRDVQPGDGIVVFRCANEFAWRAWAPQEAVQPTPATGPREH